MATTTIGPVLQQAEDVEEEEVVITLGLTMIHPTTPALQPLAQAEEG